MHLDAAHLEKAGVSAAPAEPSSHINQLSGPARRPARKSAKTFDRGFGSLKGGKLFPYIPQPGEIPFARLVAQSPLRLFQFLI
jgi:hypothetical protein